MRNAAVLMRDLVQREATRDIPVASVSNSERYIEPTEKTIAAMMASFKLLGQLSPIIVHAVTRNTYRIVAGQTRFKAASRLGWKTIRAEIIAGAAIDYKIIELAENIDRRDLRAAQRKECRGKLKAMLQERFSMIETARGGRGRKGGLREAARQAGVPESTARDARKVRENTDPRAVSDTPSPAGDKSGTSFPSGTVQALPRSERGTFARVNTELMLPSPLSVKITVGERRLIERFNAERCGGGSLSDCMRKLIRESLQRYGYWHEPAGNGATADASAGREAMP